MGSNVNRLYSVQHLLRLTYGLIPIAAGLDKFFNILTTWEQYVSPSVARLLPFSTITFMHIVGVIEIAAGVVVLSRFTALGAYVVAAWLALIAVSLISSGHFYDIAVRDLVIAVGAYSLGVLSEALGESRFRAKPSQAEQPFPASA
jgi:uncharacterized membrane protein YphA (DoxX/SURF4 family)